MARKYEVISADGHLEIPLDLWRHRVPSECQGHLPQLVSESNGTWSWQAEDFNYPAGSSIDEAVFNGTLAVSGPYVSPDGTPRYGCGGPEQRAKEQDAEGIDAEVLFPPDYVLALARPSRTRDRAVSAGIIGAYNSYLAEEFCSIAPERFIGIGVVPETGTDDAIKEMERCRQLGLAGVNLERWPNGGDAHIPYVDDRFFAAATDLSAALASHGGFGGPWGDAMTRDPNPARTLGVSRAFVVSHGGVGLVPAVIGQAILGGLFDRLPDLKLYFAEAQAGWLGYYLSIQDEFFQRWYPYHDIRLRMLPSDYIRDHCRFGFTCDRLGMAFRYDTGLELVMWGSNCPHKLGTFPQTGDAIKSIFDGVPTAEKEQVLVDNPSAFFGLQGAKVS